MAPLIPNPQKIKSFASEAIFEAWLAANHSRETELWLKIHKKDSGLSTVTYAQAVDVALCWGWIDGIRKAFDERSFLQRYTPRRSKSIWSQINRDHVARLIAAGRMTPHGQRQIDAAKADGRWEAAYAPIRSATEATLPEDLRAAIEASPEAREMLQTLGRTNLFALAFRTNNMKTPAGRAKKIAALVAMLARGETIVPGVIACILTSTFLGLSSGCAPEGPGPVQPSMTLTTTADEDAKGPVETATSSAGPPGKGADTGTADAGWVGEHPELRRLFTTEPACSRSEQFLRDMEGSATIHAYEVYSPGVAQEDIERRFRESAKELGYTVRESVAGRGFEDSAKGISAYLGDARLTVLLKVTGPLPRAAGTLAKAVGFATWPVLAALTDASWKHIRINRSAKGKSLDVEIEVGAKGHGDIDRWAQAHQLERSAEGWLQKWQSGPAPRAGIVFDFDASKAVTVGEHIGEELSGEACQDHPTRKAKVAPTKPSPGAPTDDQLMKQMMGN